MERRRFAKFQVPNEIGPGVTTSTRHGAVDRGNGALLKKAGEIPAATCGVNPIGLKTAAGRKPPRLRNMVDATRLAAELSDFQPPLYSARRCGHSPSHYPAQPGYLL
jgi:hypothetical protein